MSRYLLIVIVALFSWSPAVGAYDDHGGRDPFWPLISSSGTIVSYGEDVAASDMVLEGIVSDANGIYTAIINGNIIKAGDMLGLFMVESINAKTVYLVKGSEKFELNLKKGGE